MAESFYCSDCERLKHDYEKALRAWARATALAQSLPSVSRARKARLVFEATLDRDVIGRLLRSHLEKCQAPAPMAEGAHANFDLGKLQDACRTIGQRLFDLRNTGGRFVR